MRKLYCITYNTFSGLPGKNEKESGKINETLYYKKTKQISEFERDLISQIELVIKLDPDFFIVTEIPRVDIDKVKEYSERSGYVTIYAGVSRNLKNKEYDLGVIIASKLEGEEIKFDSSWEASAWGIVGIRLHQFHLSIIGVHLDTDEGRRNKMEIPLLAKVVMREAKHGNEVIIMGDLNCRLEDILGHKSFLNYNLKGHNEPTFRFDMENQYLNIDHILIPDKKGWNAQWKVLNIGTSDHYLVEAHIKTPF